MPDTSRSRVKREPHMKDTHLLLGWFFSRPVFKTQRFAGRMRLLSDVILSAGGCANTVHPRFLDGVTDWPRHDFIQERNNGDPWSGIWYLNMPRDTAGRPFAYCFEEACRVYL